MRSDPEIRRSQIIAAAIKAIADIGLVEFTFSEVAARADVSVGLVVHYFGDKDALLEAAFRSVVRRLNEYVIARLRIAAGPRARIEALVEAHLGHNEFAEESARVWLSFWGQALHVPRLARVQRAHQQRMLSNLRFDLRQLATVGEVGRLAEIIASMIDGVWLRSAMTGGFVLQSGLARDLILDFIARNVGDGLAEPAADSFDTINPANGDVLATIRIDGSAEVDRAVARAAHAQRGWAKVPGVERGRILHRAAALLIERNDVLARLETLDTGKPIQETIAVDSASKISLNQLHKDCNLRLRQQMVCPEHGKVEKEVRLPIKSKGGRMKPVYASVVMAGDELVAVSRSGGVCVLSATPDLKVLGTNHLEDDSEFNATPAVSQGQLFLRSNRAVYCIASQ